MLNGHYKNKLVREGLARLWALDAVLVSPYEGSPARLPSANWIALWFMYQTEMNCAHSFYIFIFLGVPLDVCNFICPLGARIFFPPSLTSPGSPRMANWKRAHPSHSDGIWHQWDAALGVIFSIFACWKKKWPLAFMVVGYLKCLLFRSWFRLHWILNQLYEHSRKSSTWYQHSYQQGKEDFKKWRKKENKTKNTPIKAAEHAHVMDYFKT